MKIPHSLKYLSLASLGCLVANVEMKAIPVVTDSFSGTVGVEPVGWDISSATDTQNGTVTAESLDYAGLAGSTGGHLALKNKTRDYVLNFSDIVIAEGESIYFSVLVSVDEIALNFGNEHYGSFQLEGGSGQGVHLGLGSGSYDSETPGDSLWGVSVAGRRGYGHTDSSTSADSNVIGSTYLLVGSYTRDAGSGTVSAWVNPNSSSFGGDAPVADLTTTGSSNISTFNSFEIVNTGSTGAPLAWSLDELRIGTSWGEVTPTGAVPEPGTMAFILGIFACGWVFVRRKK